MIHSILSHEALCVVDTGGFQDYVWKCHDLQQAGHHLPQGGSETVALWNEDLESGMKLESL